MLSSYYLPSRFAKALLLLVAVWGGGAASSLLAEAVEGHPKEIEIGYQKWGALALVRAHHEFDTRLSALGVTVKWFAFPAGPQLLEALNVGSVSFGDAGEAPPIFAQAAGTPLVYVAYEPANPGSEAILVPKGSPIRTLGDLKGKRVATNKASNTHYFLLRALESVGLQYGDIAPVYLAPSDALAAFQGGNIDAWVVWEPYETIAEATLDARLLADGTNLVSNYSYYLARREFAEKNPEIVKILLEEIAKADAWSDAHPKELVAETAPDLKIPPPLLEAVAVKQHRGAKELTPEIVASQQRVADAFLKEGLLAAPVRIADALTVPSTEAKR